MDELTDALVERLFRYLAVTSQSDPRVATLPSTPGQSQMTELLAGELHALGLSSIQTDEHGNLTALLPGTISTAPRIGFVTHVDTVDVGLSPHIHPQRRRFDGADLCLNAAEDIWLRAADHPELLPYVGEEIVFGDGTSVLGADNKAAVTIVMTLLHRLLQGDLAHGDIAVAFVPDEETGLRGAKQLLLDRFTPQFAFTIDACGRGELTIETFNAARADIHIIGVPAHPMAAKNVMVNPVKVAADLMALFDPQQTPEHTDGRDGYWWFNEITANAAGARLFMSIRDFDDSGFEQRKRYVNDAVARTRETHPRANITCAITDVYRNIAAALAQDPRPMALLEKAFAAVGVPPIRLSMRGGTDGSALSARGLPTPNYFTGALNFHSRFECLPLSAFHDAYLVTERLCMLAAASR
jgi:tripeptide aminopeptidase